MIYQSFKTLYQTHVHDRNSIMAPVIGPCDVTKYDRINQ